MGDDNDDDGGNADGIDGSGDSIVKNALWRYGWKAEPSYSIGFMAEGQGFWEDEGISSPNVEEGFGSGDAAKRVGTGNEELGMASVFPVVTNYVEGGDYQIYGVGKARSQMGLIYAADRVSGPEDLEGRTITLSSSAPQELSWPVFRDEYGYSEGDIEVTGSSEEGATAQLVQGQIDGVFDTISDFASIRMQTDLNVEFAPMYQVRQIFGYPLFVNNEFLESDQGMEYMSRLMTGYSKAAKWVLLNPEETIDAMRNDVNDQLQVLSDEALEAEMKAAVFAVNLTETTKEKGFGYLDTEVLENTVDLIAAGSDFDAPSINDLANTEIQENAELATFSDDEWDQAIEYAGLYNDYYQ